MTDSRILRAALLQATWTGDKESMIEKHIDYTRQARHYKIPVGATRRVARRTSAKD